MRPATSADVKPLVAVMARAFYDDPPFIWVLPDPATRLERAHRAFATLTRGEALAHGGLDIALTGSEIAGPRSGCRRATGRRASPGSCARCPGSRAPSAAAWAQPPHWRRRWHVLTRASRTGTCTQSASTLPGKEKDSPARYCGPGWTNVTETVSRPTWKPPRPPTCRSISTSVSSPRGTRSCPRGRPRSPRCGGRQP